MSRLEAEHRTLDTKRQRVIDLYTDGDISKEEKTTRLAKIAEQLGKVSEELARERESEMPTNACCERSTRAFSFGNIERACMYFI